MEKKSIYVSGKITGCGETATRERFKKAQKELEEKGYEVINPFDVTDEFVKEFGGSLSWGKAMICCLISLNLIIVMRYTCWMVGLTLQEQELRGTLLLGMDWWLGMRI